jgi:hypothetical protein
VRYVEESRPPLWSSGQSSLLQIQFDSRRYQIFWEVVGLERGPLSLVSTTEELLGRKCSGFGLENREYGRRDQWLCPRDILHPRKLALTSPTSGDRLVGLRPRSLLLCRVSKLIVFELLLTTLRSVWLVSTLQVNSFTIVCTMLSNLPLLSNEATVLETSTLLYATLFTNSRSKFNILNIAKFL